MKVFYFKTNIRCGGCLKKVSPFLDKLPNIKHWSVDLETNDKILTVQTSGLPDEVIQAVQMSGFSASNIQMD